MHAYLFNNKSFQQSPLTMHTGVRSYGKRFRIAPSPPPPSLNNHSRATGRILLTVLLV